MTMLALLLAVPFVFPVRVAAQAELFPSTEVTVRYDVVGWVKSLIAKARDNETPVAMDAELAAIEPAAGGGGGHGEPAAHGKSEGQKSFSGKDLTSAPELPTVTIGGKTVVTYAKSIEQDLKAAMPEDFKNSSDKDFLERRFNITPYAHSPARGDPNAPITVYQFTDLSCGQCMPELAKIDTALQDVSGSIYIRHIHAPMERFQDTNMPAFYGKIADRVGLFWEYRANLIHANPSTADAMFDLLVKTGVPIADARSMMLTEARRFYRQLDADALLARTFGVGRPPAVFVNGIRVGDGGIPLDKLPDVLKYVNTRLERGLPEPPK
ncbi:MAG: hypothetical protein EON60_08550 [Alphaproteobacteria bacterium]|nr:MAG: hypothetical protein EON60_08550 [Alphaproteobacteria bacterium]